MAPHIWNVFSWLELVVTELTDSEYEYRDELVVKKHENERRQLINDQVEGHSIFSDNILKVVPYEAHVLKDSNWWNTDYSDQK